MVQIAIGFKEMSEITKNLHAEAEAAKEIIDTMDTDFPTDVAKIYNKVQQLQRLWKLDIIAVWNNLTKSTGAGGVVVGTTIYKNFIEWLESAKTFLINKDGSLFWMLKYTSSSKKRISTRIFPRWLIGHIAEFMNVIPSFFNNVTIFSLFFIQFTKLKD